MVLYVYSFNENISNIDHALGAKNEIYYLYKLAKSTVTYRTYDMVDNEISVILMNKKKKLVQNGTVLHSTKIMRKINAYVRT